MNKRRNLIIIFSIMIIMALNDSTRGVLLPYFEKDFNLTSNQMALIINCGYVGSLVFLPILAYIENKVSKKKVLCGFIGALIVSNILLSVSKNFVFLILTIFLSVGCSSIINMQLNILTPIMFAAYQGMLISMLHFFYGMGITISQTSIGRFLEVNSNWRIIYIFISLILLIPYIYILIYGKEFNVNNEKNKNEVVSEKKSLFKDRTFYLFIIIIALYCMAEHGTMNWYITYLQKELNFNITKSSYLLSLFFGLLTIGRLFGGVLIDKINKRFLIIVLGLLGGLVYLLGVILQGEFIILISLSGILFSIIYPTFILIIKELYPENTTYATSIIVTLATCVEICLNTILGKVIQIYGYGISFYIMPLSLIGMAIFMIRLCNLSKKTKHALANK